MKYIDLFCGIGGFHQVFKSLDEKFQCVLASDIDKKCQQVYKENYNIDVKGDLKKIENKDIGEVDIICGGFPCQAFSNSGKKKCFQDERGLLFDEIIRIAKDKKPKFMFLENVKHILKVSNGEVIEYIKDKIDKTGYHLQYFVISPHQYGVPQQRERVYFICIRKDIFQEEVKLQIEEQKEIKFEDYLDKEFNDKYKIEDDILKCLQAWEEMIKIFEVGEKISPTILAHEFYRKYTKEEKESLPEWKKDYMKKNQRVYQKYKKHWDEWYKKHEEILNKREVYGKLEWQVGEIKEDDSIFNYFIQIRQSGIRVKRAKYFPTLVAISQIPIYGKEKRYLTPKECLRLQSFPDDLKLLDDRSAYKQLGNSINVGNARNVIQSTLSQYNVI